MAYSHARRHPQGYECSSAGDWRFSALYAVLDDGYTIESSYQLLIKGYWIVGDDWRFGKSKPPLVRISRDDLWQAYLNLWRLWASQNPELMAELRVKAISGVLTDCFASTEISQARALAHILNETS